MGEKMTIGVIPTQHHVDEVNFAFNNVNGKIRNALSDNDCLPRMLLRPSLFKDYKDVEQNGMLEAPLTEEQIKEITSEILQCNGIVLQNPNPTSEYEKLIVKICKENGIDAMAYNGFTNEYAMLNPPADFKKQDNLDAFVKGFKEICEATTAFKEEEQIDEKIDINKPRIACFAKQLKLTDDIVFMRVPDEIRYAVYKSGGIPCGIMPQTKQKYLNTEDELVDRELTEEEKQDIISELENCDGIVLPGGVASNEFDLFVAKYAFEHDIPLMGICAGMNNVVRALGGSAIAKTDPETREKHNNTKKFAHGLEIVDKDSKFYNSVQSDNFEVNSLHTYFIDKEDFPNDKLSVVALDDEGNIEVVEAKDKQFVVGVKYHPELLVDYSKEADALFDNFVCACEKNMRKKQEIKHGKEA